MHKSLLKHVSREELVLDAGCGCFQFSNNLRKHGRKVTTIDVFNCDIAEAKRNNFLLASIESLPFKDNSFDSIYCLSVLEFVTDDTSAISEFQRILKPGGNLLFTVPTSRSAFRLLRGLEVACGVYRWPQFSGKHYRYYTRGAIRKLVGDKFAQIDIWGYKYNFVPRLCGFLISVSRVMSILRLLRLRTLPERVIRRVSKKSPSISTTPRIPDEASNIDAQENGGSDRPWGKVEFFSDMSWHYVVALKNNMKRLPG